MLAMLAMMYLATLIALTRLLIKVQDQSNDAKGSLWSDLLMVSCVQCDAPLAQAALVSRRLISRDTLPTSLKPVWALEQGNVARVPKWELP